MEKSLAFRILIKSAVYIRIVCGDCLALLKKICCHSNMPAGIQFLALFYNWSINYKYIDAVLLIRCDGKTELE